MTKNFKLDEFLCKSGAPMPDEVFSNIIKLANQLQILRDYIGRPITINSAYRSPEYNATIPNASKYSQHQYGKAADIVVESLKPAEVKAIIEDLIEMGLMLQGGLSAYDTFTHYDIRKKRARW
jgi:uncharacterized protein YcbK (DUF882 family)